MILRLLFGLVKGLVVGGLLGLGLVQLGMGTPGALVAYLGAAAAGVIVGLVAGKPIWAEGGRIEAGLKAGVGALLAMGLMWLSRSFLAGVGLGFAGLSSAALGTYAVTSLGLVAAVLGGFYDADNTPTVEGEDAASGKKVRIEGRAPEPEIEDFEEDASQDKRARK
jgi:hypothetical protein